MSFKTVSDFSTDMRKPVTVDEYAKSLSPIWMTESILNINQNQKTNTIDSSGNFGPQNVSEGLPVTSQTLPLIGESKTTSNKSRVVVRSKADKTTSPIKLEASEVGKEISSPLGSPIPETIQQARSFPSIAMPSISESLVSDTDSGATKDCNLMIGSLKNLPWANIASAVAIGCVLGLGYLSIKQIALSSKHRNRA
jgi:hypothetical protein